MNLVQLSGHTVDLDLLPEYCNVLDVGCRGFDFTQDILKHRPNACIVAMDPDPEIVFRNLGTAAVDYLNLALVGDKEQRRSRYASYSTGEGNMLTTLDKYYDATMLTVPCVDIEFVMTLTHTKHWDLVKLDCEGSEFDILERWPGPIATQISVEFHDGADPTNRNADYFLKLHEKLSPNYRYVQHPYFKQGAWFGHWDSVLVLRDAKR